MHGLCSEALMLPIASVSSPGLPTFLLSLCCCLPSRVALLRYASPISDRFLSPLDSAPPPVSCVCALPNASASFPCRPPPPLPPPCFSLPPPLPPPLPSQEPINLREREAREKALQADSELRACQHESNTLAGQLQRVTDR